MIFSFFRSDKLVYTTRRSDPLVLANLLRQWQDLSFLTSDFPDFRFWTSSDRKLHINTLDLKVVILALHHWVSLGHQLMVATDNTAFVAYINKQGGTYSYTLLCLVVDLFLWLQNQDIHVAIQARHILSCLNVIGLEDHLPRLKQPITTEWSLHPEIVTRIFGTWGTPTLDMFATVHSRHLPQFKSPIPKPRALAIDALSQDWQGR